MTFRDLYSIHGRAQLDVLANSPEASARVARHLKFLRAETNGNAPSFSVALTVEIGSWSEPETQEALLWEVQGEGLCYRRYPQRFMGTDKKGMTVEYFPQRRVARAQFLTKRDFDSYIGACLTWTLNWILNETGLYAVHCAGVRLDRTGILLSAPSGVGKSTTAMLLAKAGASLLHDDVIWIEAKKGGSRFFGGPVPIKLLPSTIRRFAFHIPTPHPGPLPQGEREKSPAVSSPSTGQTIPSPSMGEGQGESLWSDVPIEWNSYFSKYALFPEDIPGAIPSSSCDVLCFLERHGQSNTEFRPTRPYEAIQRLTEQSFIGTEPLVALEYLRTLVQMAESLPSFVVTLGTDWARIPDAFRRIAQFALRSE